jgi:hypothetical protein
LKRLGKSFPDSYENEGTTYQNLWDKGKGILRVKLIAMNTHTRKLENSQINNLMIYLKLLEKHK